MATGDDDLDTPAFVPGQFTSARFGTPADVNPANNVVKPAPPVKLRPTIEDLVKTVQKQRDITPDGRVFDQDDWVEIRGLDMRWHLALLERVEDRPFKKWDFNPQTDIPEQRSYYFVKHGGSEKGSRLHPTDLRAPEEGLKAVFGMRPWLWQQYAFIRLEALLRFQEFHAADFEAVNIYDTVKTWFLEWLMHPENGDFGDKYRHEEEATQFLLQEHLLSPFKLMERIRDDHSQWDFSDEYITVYSYLAVLGDGMLTVFLCSLIQVAVPILLVIDTIERGTEGELPPQLEEFPDNFCLNNIFDPDVNLNEEIIIKKLVLTLIILIYVLKVIPDTWYSFTNVAGISGSSYSRLNSLRNIVYTERNDDTLQWLGFKLDRWMNTAYLNILYFAMLFILFLTDNILDIILNALAINFIHEIDENLANAAWWDRDFRWIKSGAMQLVFQTNIDVKSLKRPRKLCDKYMIDYGTYSELFKEQTVNVPSMRDLTLAKKEDLDEKNRESKNGPMRLRDEDEPFPRFGVLESFFGWLKWYLQGQFNHYEAYRVWSRWNQIIYLSEVPQAIDDEMLQQEAKTSLADNKPMQTFFGNIVKDVLSTKQIWRGMGNALTSGRPETKLIRFFVRFVEGIIDWLTYALPLSFPAAVIGFLGLYFTCR